MRKNSRTSTSILAAVFAFALMAAMGVFAVGCASGEADAGAAADEATEAAADAAADAAEDGVTEGATGTAGAGDFAAAEGLVGQVLSRDEIESAVGSDVKFEMSGAGCERGVYQGIFYYDGFSIYSRTYDKGQTFSIISVSE